MSEALKVCLRVRNDTSRLPVVCTVAQEQAESSRQLLFSRTPSENLVFFADYVFDENTSQLEVSKNCCFILTCSST